MYFIEEEVEAAAAGEQCLFSANAMFDFKHLNINLIGRE